MVGVLHNMHWHLEMWVMLQHMFWYGKQLSSSNQAAVGKFGEAALISITNTMCCTKMDSILGNSLTLFREDRGVQRPCLLLPKLDDMLQQGCHQWER